MLVGTDPAGPALFGFLDARDEQKRSNIYLGNIRNALILQGHGAAPDPLPWADSATAPAACTFYLFP